MHINLSFAYVSCVAQSRLTLRFYALCRFFETFSYLPPLTDDQIAKQVDYIIRQGWTPCLEFSRPEGAYVKDYANIRYGGSANCGYYDNRCAAIPVILVGLPSIRVLVVESRRTY